MNTNVFDFNISCDGVTLCTEAIQSAIDTCAKSGGGVVTVPAGIYRTGTIWLRSNVELHLEHGAVIKGSDNLDDYNAEDAYPQNFSCREEGWLGKHLILAVECENVAITGTGTVDGNGEAFLGDEIELRSCYMWSCGGRREKDKELLRPGQLICFVECRRVTVKDITITNQPAWGCFLHGCEYVSVTGIKVFNQQNVFNTDGIDIDCCKKVTVSNCMIDTGDDGIAIRGAGSKLKHTSAVCEHVTVSNCILGSSACGFRIGVGDGTIRHVRVSNVCITRCGAAIKFMSAYHGIGNTVIDDVYFSGISITKCSKPFELVEQSLNKATITNILIENVNAEIYGFVEFNVQNTDTVKNIKLKNWRMKTYDGMKPFSDKCYEQQGTFWFRAENTHDLKLEDFSLYDEIDHLARWSDGTFSFKNCQDLSLLNVTVNDKVIEKS